MSDILDLDVLMPSKKIVKLGGKEINVGFIPAGSTWEIERIQKEAAKLDKKKIEEGGDETRKGVELTFQLCAAFCEPQFPEMNANWFKNKIPITAVQKLAAEINKTLIKTLEQVDEYSKNGEAGQ